MVLTYKVPSPSSVLRFTSRRATSMATASASFLRCSLFRAWVVQPPHWSSQQHRRSYLARGYYYPFTARMDDDEYFMPPPSERTMYTNLFDQADNPKLFDLEDKYTLQHADLKPTDDIAQYSMTAADPHRLEWAHMSPEAFYYQFFEHTFPKQPDLSKGELATGALVTRTSVWHTPGEPAIQSIARFEPSNFRAAGYAENNFVPPSTPPDYHNGLAEMRLDTGHSDRRALNYLMQAAVLAYTVATVRHVLYWVLYTFMTMEPGMQWPKPIEVKYKHLTPGQQMVVSAGGSQVFIRHRSDEEIRSARADDHLIDNFRDPELDSDRCPDPEWLICSAVCTHFGCLPHRGGMYGGFLCPCHGSHYDASGRIRAGPAPKNLPLVRTEPIDEDTIIIGETVPTERRWT